MTRVLPIAVVLSLALTACGSQAGIPLDHGWAPPGACVFVGNRADKHYCATTATQLLSNPDVYDGQLIQVAGIVVASSDGGDAYLFLTREAFDGGEPYGTVNLKGPDALALARFAHQSNSIHTPVQARVSGRFRLYGLAPDGSRVAQGGNDTFRFGAIDEIEWRP